MLDGFSKERVNVMSDSTDPTDRVRDLLHEVAETHHRVYRITDGADEDWATWYSDWLTRLSELPGLLARKPVRSELTHHLVLLDRDYATTRPDQPWELFYAERLVRAFG
jgi:hypothetical protein